MPPFFLGRQKRIPDGSSFLLSDCAPPAPVEHASSFHGIIKILKLSTTPPFSAYGLQTGALSVSPVIDNLNFYRSAGTFGAVQKSPAPLKPREACTT